MATATPMAPREEGTLFGHPKGLAFLFFTEMWERFSFYGMRALLTLYMVNFLFLQPDVGAQVLGFNFLKHLFQPGKLDVQPLASTVYGLYTGFVYLTPFVGGLLADKILGRRRAVILGAVLMAIGHFLMAIQSMFFLALMFLILGNGAFKPNISTQVGGLYKQGDPRRDRAFSIFYVGINIGAFFSPLVCGTLGQTIGWHWGFGAAGVGMVVGLIVYLCGQKYLPHADDAAVEKAAGSNLWTTIFGYILLTPVAIVLMMMVQASPLWVKLPLAAVLLAAVVMWLVGLPKTEQGPVVGLCVLCFCTIFFWATYEQQGNTVQIWADKYTDFRLVKNADARAVLLLDDKKKGEVQLDSGEILADAGGQYYAIKGDTAEKYKPLAAERAPILAELKKVKDDSDSSAKKAVEENSREAADEKVVLDKRADELQTKVDAIDAKIHPLFGLAVPTTWFQSFNPFLIFTLTPFIIWFWRRQASKKKEPGTVAKMAIGCFLVGASYAVMVLGSGGAAGGFKSSILWLVAFSVVVTLGELYVSPIGLSLVTKLAPARMVSMLMGVWFLATFVGNNTAGWIGTFFEHMSKPMFWVIPTLIAGGTAILIFALHHPVQKAIGGGESAADV